jgi:hypothetical protein
LKYDQFTRRQGGNALPVITIFEQMCSLGDEIAESLANKLGWDLIARNNLFNYFPDIAANPFDLKCLMKAQSTI